MFTKKGKKINPILPAHFTFIDNPILKIVFYVVLFLALALLLLVIGMMIGFSVLGDGNPLDVLDWKTWQHILDFLK